MYCIVLYWDWIVGKDKLNLNIAKAARSDSGTYNLKLSNEVGEDSVPIVVNVVGQYNNSY